MSNNSPNEGLTLDDLKRHFDSLTAGVQMLEQKAPYSSESSTDIPDPYKSNPYLSAAAVLVFFEPDKIQPLSNNNALAEEEKKELIYELVSYSQLVVDTKQALNSPNNRIETIRYFLKDQPRREVLNVLMRENKLDAAIQANHNFVFDSNNILQQMLHDVLKGNLAPIQGMDIERLNALTRISDWLPPDMGVKIPSKQDIAKRTQLAELIASFKQLTGKYVNGLFQETFRGRQKELSTLRKYVGVSPPQGTAEHINRALLSLSPFYNTKYPLLVYGIGGVGKSSLLAKFILEHLEASISDRFPFVYLDFDRPNLSANEPDTLLVEAARQLSIQFADDIPIYNETSSFYDRWKNQFILLSEGVKTQKIVLKSIKQTEERMSSSANIRKEFIALISFLNKHQRKPFLLLMDTFEEVQYKGPIVVEELYDFIAELRNGYSQLRVVVAGRAPVTQRKLEQIQLLDLDAEAAQGFLLRHGITDPRDALDISIKVGGNPLTLKLAVGVINEIGITAFKKLKMTDKNFLFFEKRVSTPEIQGILYERILDHIHDPRVVKLAHPGLVLRFITPELIWKVLSEPCELGITSIEDAQSLFTEMGKEVSLVTPSGPDTLRHRTDIRKVMLSMIEASKPDIVKAIRKQAIKYFSRQEGMSARAEEIYHRLCLDQPSSSINARWLDGIQDSLTASFEEYPNHARTFLASRTGIDNVEQKLWNDAASEDKERILVRRVADCLNNGNPQKALDLINKNGTKENTILKLLEVRSMLHLGKVKEAYKIANEFSDNPSTYEVGQQMVNEIMEYLKLNKEGKIPINIKTLGNFKKSSKLYYRRDDDMTELPLA